MTPNNCLACLPAPTLKTVKHIVRERLEERVRNFGQTTPQPERARLVHAVRDRPNLGYRDVPAAEDDPITGLQPGNLARKVRLRFPHVQNGRSHANMLSPGPCLR